MINNPSIYESNSIFIFDRIISIMIIKKRRSPLIRIHHSKEFSDQNLKPYLENFHHTTIDNHIYMGSKSPMIYKRKILANQSFSIDKAMKLYNFIKEVHSHKQMSQSNIRKNKENIKRTRNSSQFDRYPIIQRKPEDRLEFSNASIGYKNIRKLCRRKQKYRSQLKLTQVSPWSNKHSFLQYQCLELYELKD